MCVRPSTASYGGFSLDMGRSPGFGSARADLRPVKTRSPFGSGPSALNLAGSRNSPDRSTKSTRFATWGRPAACRRRVSGSLSLPSRGSFHLSFTVLCSIGHWVVFSLGGWSPLLPARFHVSRGTLDPAHLRRPFAYGAVTLCGRLSQSRSAGASLDSGGPQPRGASAPVWAPSLSLAATREIDVSFSSSGYLDVSVPRVPRARLCVHRALAGVRPAGFPHSDTHGS